MGTMTQSHIRFSMFNLVVCGCYDMWAQWSVGTVESGHNSMWAHRHVPLFAEGMTWATHMQQSLEFFSGIYNPLSTKNTHWERGDSCWHGRNFVFKWQMLLRSRGKMHIMSKYKIFWCSCPDPCIYEKKNETTKIIISEYITIQSSISFPCCLRLTSGCRVGYQNIL